MTKQTKQVIIISVAILLICLIALVAAFKHQQIKWWYWWWELARAETNDEKVKIIRDYEKDGADYVVK